VYGDSGLVRFEYKDFAVIGGESIRAAEAAACANEQGQFWPYHDTLFANQRGENVGSFREDILKLIATALGLDQTAFDSCLDSGKYRDKVEAATAAGQEQGVISTPTLFLNGEKIEGAIPFDQLQPLIEAELADTASE